MKFKSAGIIKDMNRIFLSTKERQEEKGQDIKRIKSLHGSSDKQVGYANVVNRTS